MISEAVQVALITAIPSTLLGIATLVGVFYVKKDVRDVKVDVKEVKTATDGMKSALVEATGKQKFAEGKAEGKTEQKVETAMEKQ